MGLTSFQRYSQAVAGTQSSYDGGWPNQVKVDHPNPGKTDLDMDPVLMGVGWGRMEGRSAQTRS